jgi:hypothetical protein
VVASRGPVPKRTENRIKRGRRADGLDITTAPGAENIEMPLPPEGGPDDWDDIVYEWYFSLAESGMARFYEPSDWMVAYITADWLNQLRKPQYVTMQTVGPNTTEPYFLRRPMSGSDMGAFLRVCANLGLTEGDRRRMRIELTHVEPEQPEQTPGDLETERAELTLLQGGASA